MSPTTRVRRARDARNAPGPVLARSSAALLGTLPPAWFGSTALAAVLPISENHRVALVLLLALPLWVAAMSVAFLARSGLRVWCVCLAASAVFYGVTRGARGAAPNSREKEPSASSAPSDAMLAARSPSRYFSVALGRRRRPPAC